MKKIISTIFAILLSFHALASEQDTEKKILTNAELESLIVANLRTDEITNIHTCIAASVIAGDKKVLHAFSKKISHVYIDFIEQNRIPQENHSYLVQDRDLNEVYNRGFIEGIAAQRKATPELVAKEMIEGLCEWATYGR